MFRKNNAITIYFEVANQKREGDTVFATQQSTHFEIGTEVTIGEKTKKVVRISEMLFKNGALVEFDDGIVWKYVGFKYIIS